MGEKPPSRDPFDVVFLCDFATKKRSKGFLPKGFSDFREDGGSRRDALGADRKGSQNVPGPLAFPVEKKGQKGPPDPRFPSRKAAKSSAAIDGASRSHAADPTLSPPLSLQNLNNYAESLDRKNLIRRSSATYGYRMAGMRHRRLLTTTVYFAEEMTQQLERIAEATGMSQAAIIRGAVRRMLREMESSNEIPPDVLLERRPGRYREKKARERQETADLLAAKLEP